MSLWIIVLEVQRLVEIHIASAVSVCPGDGMMVSEGRLGLILIQAHKDNGVKLEMLDGRNLATADWLASHEMHSLRQKGQTGP